MLWEELARTAGQLAAVAGEEPLYVRGAVPGGYLANLEREWAVKKVATRRYHVVDGFMIS